MPELDRRDFLKLVGVSAGTAATACSDPVEKLVPYVIQPESVTPGLASYYASTCTECPASCGTVVKTREGRPIKLEGNPKNPINGESLCARGQTSLGRTYHPDRIPGPLAQAGDGTQAAITWEEGMTRLTGSLKKASGKTYILGGPVGPSMSGVIDNLAAASGATRLVYEPFSHDALLSATQALFGIRSIPLFNPEKADLIIDMGSDFLATGPSPCENSRQFADARDVRNHPDGGTRMISISPRLNSTTQSSDEWIAAGTGSQGAIAFALARAVYDKHGAPAGVDAQAVESFLSGPSLAEAASLADVDPAQLQKVATALLSANAPLVVPPGVAGTDSSAASTATAVMLINWMTGAVGQSVHIPPASGTPVASQSDLEALVKEMKAGRVDVLLVHDSNPVYSMPAALGFQDALSQVGTVVSFASMKDETSEAAALVLPNHGNMEVWGDLAPRPGVRSLIQPTVRPLMDTQALGDTLLEATRALGGAAPEGSFHKVVQDNWSDVDWAEALGNGGVYTDVEIPVPAAQVDLAGLGYSAPDMAGSGGFKLLAFPHAMLGDGSGAALPWLQEIPDTVTKLEWNSWVELSFATAEKLGVDFGDVVEIETPTGQFEVSVFPRGGIRDDTIAIPTGQGHTVGFYASMEGEGERPSWFQVESPTGTQGVPRGVNVMSILSATPDEKGGRTWLNSMASVKKTGRFRRLALAQWTDNQRERHLAQAVTLAKANGHDDHHDEGGHGGGHHDGPPHTFEAKYDADPKVPYRWGMAIDNDRCDGCNACVAACYIENNIPVVGEAQAINHREMTWLRVERYIGEGHVGGGEERRPIPRLEKLGKLDVRYVAMPCQQCGAAPCEAVCPTLATYHNKEGLNGMIYNRCAGTRYCANNCSYKVRRFNYFDYGQENFPGMLGLMLNPDVTVRQQGVMEKCSFCVQRIEHGRQLAKDEGRPIADGEVNVACAAACPTNSITFGNLRDETSKVVKEADQPNRSYHLLQELNLRSSITYLAKVNREESEGSA